MGLRDFRELKVWQKAHDLVLAVYGRTAEYPREELFGLTSQTRRAAVSVPANIAEGSGRPGNAELARFLQIAHGSASELEYHLPLARDLNFLDEPTHSRLNDQVAEVKRMLNAFMKTLASTR